MTTVCVAELFVSIQGETSLQGYPCFFVRLAGCNLRCAYCDTPRTQNAAAGKTMSVDAVVAACRRKRTQLVMITGGEPLLQDSFDALADALMRLPGRTLMVETNGSHDIRRIPPQAVTVMDVKCPGSGENGSMDMANIERLRPQDEVKFVLSDRNDYLYALDIVGKVRLFQRCSHILFAPAAGRLEPGLLAQWMLADRPMARIQLQMHRLLDLP